MHAAILLLPQLLLCSLALPSPAEGVDGPNLRDALARLEGQLFSNTHPHRQEPVHEPQYQHIYRDFEAAITGPHPSASSSAPQRSGLAHLDLRGKSTSESTLPQPLSPPVDHFWTYQPESGTREAKSPSGGPSTRAPPWQAPKALRALSEKYDAGCLSYGEWCGFRQRLSEHRHKFKRKNPQQELPEILRAERHSVPPPKDGPYVRKTGPITRAKARKEVWAPSEKLQAMWDLRQSGAKLTREKREHLESLRYNNRKRYMLLSPGKPEAEWPEMLRRLKKSPGVSHQDAGAESSAAV